MVNHKLRAARKAKAWTIETAAEKVGVSWVTYSRWEKGTQTPYLSTVRDICKAFHKSPQDLGLEHLVEEPIEEEPKQGLAHRCHCKSIRTHLLSIHQSSE